MKRPTTWLGDQASLEQVLTIALQAETTPITELLAMRNLPKLGSSNAVITSLYDGEYEDDEEPEDYLVDAITAQIGSVGLITIEGSMVSDESFWNMIFGAVGYPTIARAAEKFSEQEDITDIVMAFSTSGGDAEGIDALSEVLKEVGTRKRLTSWTGSSALSAGYWLASSASSIRASKMAQVGSIGVITTVITQQRRLEKEGLDVTVLRSGKYKALAHPAEKLTEEAKTELQSRSDKLYGFFLEQVAGSRPVSLSEASTWAEGRVHFATEAIGLGLVDGPLITLTDLIRDLDQTVEMTETEPAGDTEMPKQIFMRDSQARAQLAAGVALDTLPHEEAAEPEAAEETEAVTTEAAETQEGEALPEAEDTTLEQTGEATSLVAYLRDEVTELREKYVTSQAALAKADQALADAQTAIEDLRPMAAEFIQIRQVSLGHAPDNDLDNLPTRALADKFASLSTEFNTRFKVGRTSLPAEAKPQTVSVADAAASCGITPVR